MTEQDRKNWEYLVAAVQNPQGSYVNARSTRYARAIVAVSKELDSYESREKVDSLFRETVVSISHE